LGITQHLDGSAAAAAAGNADADGEGADAASSKVASKTSPAKSAATLGVGEGMEAKQILHHVLKELVRYKMADFGQAQAGAAAAADSTPDAGGGVDLMMFG
jgi:hypothetical protein|tara:strand:- start:234 stop:536 length:303 start_codon:yes stop_codon:yes gene_type:complete